MGIENLKKVVVFLALLGSAIDKSTQNGLGVDDIGNLINPLLKAPDAFAALDQAKIEAKDIDAAELQEIQKTIADALELVDKDLEKVAEKALSTLVDIYGIVQEIKALRAGENA